MITAAAYTFLIWALGERVLTRISPWLGALVLVTPLAVLYILPFVPGPVRVGAFFYYAVSLLAQAAAGYGGCEIAGIPALFILMLGPLLGAGHLVLSGQVHWSLDSTRVSDLALWFIPFMYF